MNARRRSVDKWKDDTKTDGNTNNNSELDYDDEDFDEAEDAASPQPHAQQQPQAMALTRYQEIKANNIHNNSNTTNTVLVTANPAAVVQHLGQPGEALTPTASLDL